MSSELPDQNVLNPDRSEYTFQIRIWTDLNIRRLYLARYLDQVDH